MRAVVQRVSHAEVSVEGQVVASIGSGMLVLVGAVDRDTQADAAALAKKLVTMRVFADTEGKMNLSIVDVEGSILIVPQFTLLADLRRGRRPSFTGAADPEHAEPLIDSLVRAVANEGVAVEAGQFGAMMDVSLSNSGPVTFVVDVANGKVV